MKTLSTSNFAARFLTAVALVALLALPMDAEAQFFKKKENRYTDPYKGFTEEAYMDMDFLPNISTPEVHKKAKSGVKKTIRALAEQLKNKVTVDLVRDDEVVLVTFPTDDLFLPNDTMLSTEGTALLAPLLPHMKNPMMYKIVLAVHTDDTGSELYRDELSTSRLNSVYDWFMLAVESGQIQENLIIIPFAMSSTMPLADNNTRDNRALNRRLEVYFIPGPQLIDEAYKGQLK